MRAEIRQPQDAPTVARFRAVLASLGAKPVGHEWAVGVDHWRYRVGGDMLSVFSDAWSVDIEGPPELVQRIVAALQENPAEQGAAVDRPHD
jgi:hypothetical protein